MKTPEQISVKLARQWEQGQLREARLLEEPEAWPFRLPIGKPLPSLIKEDTQKARTHIEKWRSIRLGNVHWKDTSYQATTEAIEVPHNWEIPDPQCWVQIIDDKRITAEFQFLQKLIKHTDPRFHSLLIRRRSLWKNQQVGEVIQACQLALQLQPGCAQNLPLRTLSLGGNDTKFFERHESLLLALLDLVYDNEPSQVGLPEFLGAYTDHQHWLLIADLDGTLLPFQNLRLTSSQLTQQPLLSTHLLIVENESCLYQLPSLANTIAVLGTGFDLKWLSAPWLKERTVAYWGDLDTWGLDCLARARKELPTLAPILMDLATFQTHSSHTVPEPKTAAPTPPEPLTEPEKKLYDHLLQQERGRLEQEFIPKELVQKSLTSWHSATK